MQLGEIWLVATGTREDCREACTHRGDGGGGGGGGNGSLRKGRGSQRRLQMTCKQQARGSGQVIKLIRVPNNYKSKDLVARGPSDYYVATGI